MNTNTKNFSGNDRMNTQQRREIKLETDIYNSLHIRAHHKVDVSLAKSNVILNPIDLQSLLSDKTRKMAVKLGKYI